MAFKNGHYIYSGKSYKECVELEKEQQEKDAKLTSWDDVPPVTEDQDED